MFNYTIQPFLKDNEMKSGLYTGINGYEITWGYFLTHIFLIAVAGTGILLNSVALRIVRNESPLYDVSQVFISNLVMSDILNGVLCIYVALYNLIHYKNYYECAFRTGLATCINLNSSIHLLSLTFDRYFKIMYPYKYINLFTEGRMKVFSRGAWILAIILGLLPIFGWRRPPLKGTAYCTYFGVLEKGYLGLMCILFYLILLTIYYCNISIICVAWNQSKGVLDATNKTKPSKNTYDHRNTKALWWGPTNLLIILTSFYSFCWLPTGLVVVLHLFDAFPISFTDAKKGVILAYVSSLVYLNVVANPVVYAIKIKRVKRRLRSILTSRRMK